ncbi:MAG: hypothetical protein M0D53_10405 [Flavobacterium sp. JAD_PAG50586_2]|nr:MAG: hypothetical protein M0D53_10405 [Flavobacterium sp. JAD_PAG50586_2]
MKTLSHLIGYKNLVSLALLLVSLNGFAQDNTTVKSENNSRLTSLQKVVDGIKEKNASIRDEQNVNVMVNDKLVENLQSFTIDPKTIALVEVVVLEPKSGSEQRVNPSIIINTKRQ